MLFFLVESILLLAVVAGVQLSSISDEPIERWIELSIGAMLVMIALVGTMMFRWIHRNNLLETELRRARAVSVQTDPDPADSPIVSSLGQAIRDYNRDLNTSRIAKNGRIGVQRRLLETVIRRSEEEILVLSGSGTVLYVSEKWTERMGNTDSIESVRFDPSPTVIAAHLVAGKGNDIVTVEGKKMYFNGVFGRVVVGDHPPDLAYIVITERSIGKSPIKGVEQHVRRKAGNMIKWFQRENER